MLIETLLMLAAAAPVEVLEEWEIVSHSPLRESVTARGIYRREDGRRVLLPAAVQGGEPPAVFAVGALVDLPVTRGTDGWEAELPAGGPATGPVRVVARAVRPIQARLFQLRWPTVVASSVATRRVANVDRLWLSSVPDEWTCPMDVTDTVPCVSTARVPGPIAARVPPASSTRWARILSGVAIVAAMVLAAVTGSRRRMRERLVGASAGLVTGAAVSLAIAGSLVTGWAVALIAGCVPAIAVGALAMRNPRSVGAGAIGLFVIPLVAVIDGRLRDVMTVCALTAVAVIIAAWRGGTAPLDESALDDSVAEDSAVDDEGTAPVSEAEPAVAPPESPT